MMNTGIKSCDELKELNFTGNVIPQVWYKVFVKKDLKFPKPHLLAINILSDIVYWYRPIEVRDEGSGQIIGYKKKFKSDMLQRSYSQISELFGCSERQAKEAIVFLEEMGVVKRNFRTITSGGVVCANILFIELFVDRLKELTYPNNNSEPAEKTNSELPEGVCTNLYTGASENSQGVCTDFVTPPYRFSHTNTENTTEITTKTTSSPSYSPAKSNIANQKNDDEDNNKGEVSELLGKIGINKMQHKKMVKPISTLIGELMNGQSKRGIDVKDTLGHLSAETIDTVIDRYTQKAAAGEVRNADSFLKACLLSAGKSAKILELSKKLDTGALDCGNPSFDVDEYVRLSMKKLHLEK